ncbi:MAG TPA: thioredoxin fold domain-containing protein [Verrucomicrobiae bacterium]|nr:thioredoxin fold domain-containing protein [Verrucomicrobiae bacterium]
MCPKILIVLTVAVSLLAARADEQLPVLAVGGQTYTNVTVTSVSATDIFFFYAGGMGNAKLKNLSPELQKHFKFDPDKAKAAELKQADNQAKFHQAALHAPAVHGPDMSRDSTGAAPAAPALWRSDLPGALRQALSENKQVLLDFTGSDWCPWCIKFDQDVLSTARFGDYAGRNLELVKVDFPHHTPLPADQQRANDALARQFGVDGYPTYVLLNSAGREIGRQVGYLAGGPNAFVAELEKFNGR